MAQSSINGAWQTVEWGGNDSYQGAWQIENIQPSLWLFIDGYYSTTYLAGEQERTPVPESRQEMSGDEWKAMGMPFISNAGTYEITVSTITVRPIVALIPNFMSGETGGTWDYRVEGDTLHVTRTGEGWSEHFRFQRLQ